MDRGREGDWKLAKMCGNNLWMTPLENRDKEIQCVKIGAAALSMGVVYSSSLGATVL